MGNDAPVKEDGTATSADFIRIRETEEFQGLRRRHRSFVFPVVIGSLLWYLAYVLLAGYAHDFMSTPVFGNVNVGLLLGLAQVVTTFAVTMIYVSFANRKLDPTAADIRESIENRVEVTN